MPPDEPSYVRRVAPGVELYETPGRGRTVEWDGERYLPEQVVKELGRFYALVGPTLLVCALVIGFIVGWHIIP